MADSASSVNNDIPGTSGEQAQRENGKEEPNKPKRKSRKRTHDDHEQQPCCTKQRCGHKLLSSQTKENLKQEYNGQGNTGHGFAYLRRYISAETITNPHGKRKTNYRYYIPNGEEQVEVCQTAFKMVFNITEAAIRSARDERDVVAVRRNVPDHVSVQVSSNGCPEYQGVRVKEEPLDDDDVIIINTLPAMKCTCTIGHSVQFTSQDDTTTLKQFKAITNWSKYKIKECTLQKLFEEDCASLEALQLIEEQDLTSLNVQSGITRGQIILLRGLIRGLNCKQHQPIVAEIADETELARAPSTSAMSDRSFPLPSVNNDHPRPAEAPITDSGESCNSTSHQNSPGGDISLLLQLVEAPFGHGGLQVALPSVAQASDTDSSQTAATNNHDDPQHTGIPDNRSQHSRSPATAVFIPESTIPYNPSSEFSGNFSQEQNLQNGDDASVFSETAESPTCLQVMEAVKQPSVANSIRSSVSQVLSTNKQADFPHVASVVDKTAYRGSPIDTGKCITPKSPVAEAPLAHERALLAACSSPVSPEIKQQQQQQRPQNERFRNIADTLPVLSPAGLTQILGNSPKPNSPRLLPVPHTSGLGLLSSAATLVTKSSNDRGHPYETAEEDICEGFQPSYGCSTCGKTTQTMKEAQDCDQNHIEMDRKYKDKQDDKDPEKPKESQMDAPKHHKTATTISKLEISPDHNGKQQTTQSTWQPRDSTNVFSATQHAVSTLTSSHVNVNRQLDTRKALSAHVPTKPMLPKRVSLKKWKKCGQINTEVKAKYPEGIAIHPNGDVAVTRLYNPVAVFSRNGTFKHTLQGFPSDAFDIAITPSNQYIIPGVNEFYTYDSQGQLLNTTPTYDINNQPSWPKSVAVDSRGRIIVGVGCDNHTTVSIHQPDGTLTSKFQTQSPPDTITCTPDDNLIISCRDKTLQVMNQSGHNARIIQPPPNIKSWVPVYVCCSKQGELFVGNYGNPRRVFRYVCTDGEYKYVDCIAKMSWYPHSIALSANEDELFVVNTGDSIIQIFR